MYVVDIGIYDIIYLFHPKKLPFDLYDDYYPARFTFKSEWTHFKVAKEPVHWLYRNTI